MRHGDDRVLIIGAGPSGLASAIALRRVGIPAEIFEQSPRHQAYGGGFTIRSNTVKMLLRLGVGQQLLEKGVEYRWFDYYSASGRLLNRLPEGEVADAWGTPSIGALRSDLYTALMTEVDEDAVHLGAQFVGAEQDEEGVTARFADGREERGALLLGCDGMHSAVRQHVLEGAEPIYAGFICWRNTIVQEPAIVPKGEVRLYLGAGKAIVMFPCSERQLSMDCFVRGPAGGTDPPGRVKETLLSTFSDFSDTVQRGLEATEESHFSRGDLYQRDPGPTWFKGRIVLLGDSIHPTTPFVGQGAGAAMEDGIVLAKELALTRGLGHGDDVRAALTAYEWRRRDRAAWIVGSAGRRGKMVGLSNPVAASGRNFLLSKLPTRVLRKEMERAVFYE
jgi:2-polyprenyl-6-methoxyphenol hydroxylase-like FAD-dependent oxidoreductase